LRRPTGTGAARSAGAHPPRLDLGLVRRAKLLLLLNALPLLAGVVIGIGWWRGTYHFKPGSGASLVTIGVLIGACALLTAAMWVVLPVGRWLRDYPLWQVRTARRWTWLPLLVAGWLAWAVAWLLGTTAALAALALIGSGLVRLLRQAG
jgi:hypothetical protein